MTKSVVSLALLLFATAVPVVVEARDDAEGPIEMVVGLIKELKAKLEADEDAEQKIYNKFACWCETTSDRKAKAITEAKEEVARLGNLVLELKGNVATLAHEIAELTKDIAENEAAQEEATALRQKENSEYMAEKTELEQAINALERAIIVLGKGTKLLQSDQQQVMKDVKRAIALLPTYNQLEPVKLHEVTAFLRDPHAAFVQTSKSKAAYNPASSTIIGILKDMYDTMTSDLESQTEAEATGQKNFEDLIATKAKQLATLQATLAKKEEKKADIEKQLADADQALEDITNQMKEDTKFFDEMKAACKAKADEWNIRTTMRAEEIEGINKALEVLTSDEARKIFQKSIKPGFEKTPSFLQLSLDGTMSAPTARAYGALKRAAGKSHSIRLAALAATLRSSGAFKVVIDEIDKMLSVLKEEEAADIEQRDWCKEETFKKEAEKSRYEYKIEKTEAKIVKLTEKKEELEASIVATQKEIDLTHEEIIEMEDTRTQEHDAFLEAKDLDEKAIDLLKMAIEHMTSFYKKNEIDMGEIQGSMKFLQKQGPEFEVSEDQAPDATFSDAGHRKGQSKGIVSILTMLVEDLTSEIANGIKAEDEAQAEFEKQVHTAKELIATLEEKKVNLETEHAETVEKIAAEEKIQEETEVQLEAVKEELAEMKPNCDWLLGAFEKRREKRKIEAEGLRQAKNYLSGAQPGAAALTQQSTSFDDLQFPQTSFLQKRQ